MLVPSHERLEYLRGRGPPSRTIIPACNVSAKLKVNKERMCENVGVFAALRRKSSRSKLVKAIGILAALFVLCMLLDTPYRGPAQFLLQGIVSSNQVGSLSFVRETALCLFGPLTARLPGALFAMRDFGPARPEDDGGRGIAFEFRLQIHARRCCSCSGFPRT